MSQNLALIQRDAYVILTKRLKSNETSDGKSVGV